MKIKTKTILNYLGSVLVALGLTLTFAIISYAQFAPYFLPEQGGTGTSTAPSFGQILVGNSSGSYDVVATSTLAIDLTDTTGSITESRISDLGSYLLDSGDTATGNYDFDSGTLYVDATNNRVGIGVTNPQTTLDVNGIIRGGGGTTEANIQARNGQNIFRGLDGWTGTWSDSVATTYFQVGRNGGNTAFSSLYGALFNRLAFMTSNLQVTNGTGTLTPPTNFFQVDYNGDNKFSVTSAGLVGVTTSTPAAQLAVEGQGSVPSFMVSDTSNNTDFIITSAGLAGFGTANPQTQAHVYTDTASAQSVRMENASTSGYAEFYAKSNGATERVSYGVAGSAVGNALADYAYIYTDTGLNGLSINTNGSATPKMVINNSGNIGVGTVNPSSVSDKFIHVYSAGSAGYTLENAYNKWSFFVQNVTGSYGLYNHGLSDYAYIITDNDNHVGVATNTPFAQLSVEGQGTAPAFAVSDTSNNTDLIVDSGGDVGVGMTLDIINETNSTQGYITQNGTRLLHTYSSESPSTNLFVGLGAGNFTSSAAIANVGIGETALDALTTGDYNNAVGRVAGSAITSGFNNNAMGNGALAFLNTGSNNNAVGNAALLNITGSSYNVGIGSGAGRGITSGTGNTYIGTYSGYPNDASTGVISGLTNATAIGYNSTVNASNSLILGAVSPFGLVNVGIGTSTPLAKLSIFAASDDTVSNLLTVSSSTTSGEDTHFLIERSGNVGVSTTTPFTNFSVSGNAVITGSLYDNNFSDGNLGDVLQSTGSGYTWVATSTLGLGGSGGGSVTSVGMSVPTGLTISGSPITSAGTLAVGLDTGYLIPTSTRLVQHDTAYSWGDHSTQGYLTASPFGAAIDPTELASADFGDFTCNGTTCTLDTDYITEAELDTIAELNAQITDATLLQDGCTDCLNATEIEDIYLLIAGDTSSGNYTWTGVHNFSGGVVEVTNGTNPTVDAAGELALDTTDNQLLIADSGNTARVFARAEVPLFSVTVASTSVEFLNGGVIPIAKETKDGRDITQYRCYVDGGTSVVVNVSDGTNDTETITCATTVTSDTDVATNSTFTANEKWELQIGAITGSPDYLVFEAYGYITRE